MPNSRKFLLGLALALAVSACQPNSNNAAPATVAAPAQPAASAAPAVESVDPSPALLIVDGKPITEAAVQHFLAQLGRPPHPDPERARQIVVDELVKRALMAKYALDHKLDQDINVYLTLQRSREQVLMSAARQDFLKHAPEITEKQVRARYDEEIAKSHKTEYRAQHILTDTEEQALAAIADLKKGKKFEDVAKARSKDTNKDKGGELGWIRQDSVPPEFFAALTQLNKGQFTQTPVQTSFGWHVIKVMDTRELTPVPYEKIKGRVRALLQQEYVEAKANELRAAAVIQTVPQAPAEPAPAQPAADGKK